MIYRWMQAGHLYSYGVLCALKFAYYPSGPRQTEPDFQGTLQNSLLLQFYASLPLPLGT